MVVTRNQRTRWKSFDYEEAQGSDSPGEAVPSCENGGDGGAIAGPQDGPPPRSPACSENEAENKKFVTESPVRAGGGEDGGRNQAVTASGDVEAPSPNECQNGKAGVPPHESVEDSPNRSKDSPDMEMAVKDEVEDKERSHLTDEGDAQIQGDCAMGAIGANDQKCCGAQTRLPVNSVASIGGSDVKSEPVVSDNVKSEPCAPNGSSSAHLASQKSALGSRSPWTASASPSHAPEKKEEGMTMHVCSVPIEFPHSSPYVAQRQLMVKLVQACQKEQCALLESPTGTGKTLALLCSALAWQQTFIVKMKKKRQSAPPHGKYTPNDGVKSEPCPDISHDDTEKPSEHIPKIFYATRTHTQVKQVVRELKKTKYTPKMTVLGSRDQYCIHSEISQLKRSDKQDACLKATRGTGMYSCLLAERAKQQRLQDNHIFDIEDLVGYGKSEGFCPYFASKEWQKEAELVLCPYNYILDPAIMTNMEISLKNNIVIFDEAHNLEDIARESCKISMTMKDMIVFKNDLTKSGLPAYEELNRLTLNNIMAVVVQDTQVHNEQRLRNRYANPPIYRGFLFEEFLKRIGWTIPELEVIGKAVSSVLDSETASIKKNGHGNLAHAEASKCLDQLDRAAKFLCDPSNRLCYMGVTVDSSGDSVLKLDCLWPGVAGHHLRQARALILSSGTLHPMDTFSGELGIKFPIQLQANHAVNTKKQVTTISPLYGCNGGEIVGTMKKRDHTYYETIGTSLVKLAEISPHGMLVFMASYELLRKMKEEWMGSGVWAKLSRHKYVLEEPRDSEEMKEVMKRYSRLVHQHTRGEGLPPLLLSVCRGRVSEGFDFKDNMCRLVVTIGIPYPNLGDPVIQSKRIFNDKYKDKYNVLTGDQWYSQCAFRSLNQSLGRVLRHAHDYGAIVLLDGRFHNGSMDAKLSKWVQSTIQRTNSLDDSLPVLVPFYEKNADLQKVADEQAEEAVDFDDGYDDAGESRRLPQVFTHRGMSKRAATSNPFFRYQNDPAPGPPKRAKKGKFFVGLS